MATVHIQDSLVLRVVRKLQAARLAPATDGRAAISVERLLRDQPEVLAFVLAGTAQLAPETRVASLFLGDVIVESFRLAGRPPRPVKTSEFMTALRENREMALRVGQAHDRFAERYLKYSRTLRQPALIRYVTEVLLAPAESFPHRIAKDDLGALFVVLKSVIDVLDRDARGEAPARESTETSTDPL